MIILSDLKLNEANPRVIKDDKFKKLVESIKSFPQMMDLRPIVVDESNVIQGIDFFKIDNVYIFCCQYVIIELFRKINN